MDNQYLKYRQEWALADTNPLTRPLHLDIEINNDCNHKCLSCWHSDPSERSFKLARMPNALVISLLKQGGRLHVPAVKFNLRGEPTIHKKLIFYAKLAEEFCYIDRLINTNGSFSLDMANQLNRYFNTIILSLDSVQAINYMRLHRVHANEYFTLRENIEHFTQLRRAGALNAKIILNYHRNELNKDECLDDFIKTYPFFAIRESFTRVREGKNISILEEYDPSPPVEKLNYCYHANRRLTILANGKVYPCCMCYNEPDDILLGNANETRISMIWRGQNRMDLLKKFKSGVLPKTCKECTSNMRMK